MSTEKDLCPNQQDGKHRYFVFKAVEVFVPVQDNLFDVEGISVDYNLYEKKSIVVSGCNCGASLVQEVPIV